MEIRELLQKRASLWDEAKKFLDDHTDKDGKISAEDAAAYDKMEADIDALSKSIERYERNARIGAELDKPFNTPHFEPFNNNSAAGKTGRASNEYKAAMLSAIKSKFRKVSNLLEESVDTSGGYLVPESWNDQLITILDSENVIRSLAKIITTDNARKFPMVASRPVASVVAEGAAMTFSNVTFGIKTLDAYKLVTGVQVTSELLQDNAFDLENFLITEFGEALARKEEELFISGSGTGEPTGIITSIASSATETATSTLKADEIIDLVYALKRPYRRNAVFLTKDSTLALLRKFKDSSSNYLWQPSLVAGEPDRFMGYKVYTSEFMPAATAGNIAILFGDFKRYYVADRTGRSVQVLNELYAVNDLTAFIMRERVDGILMIDEAIKGLKIKA